jgi:hypothetical protein
MPFSPRPARLPLWAVLTLMLVPSWCGCLWLENQPPKDFESFLRSVEALPGSVTLEVFHVRFSADQQEQVRALWKQVDEQQLPASLRRELMRNGFRAGILGGALPDTLALALGLQSEMPESSPIRMVTEQTARPRIKRRVLQLAPDQPATIHPSEQAGQIELLVNRSGEVVGKTYTQAESVYSMEAELIDGQSVEVRLTPEVHHGDLRNRYTGVEEQGIFLVTSGREREVFDDMQIHAELAPGELIVVGSMSDMDGSLGHFFHSDQGSQHHDDKLILVRLLRIPRTDILANH